MKYLALVALLVALPAGAVDVTATWVHPTQYTDGSALALDNIKETHLQYGTCTTATTPTFGIMAGEKYVAAPQATWVFTGVAAGTYCFRARTTDLQSRTSAWTAAIKKAVVDIKPKVPTGLVIG